MNPRLEANLAAALAEAIREEVESQMMAHRNGPPALLDIATAARVIGVSRTTLYGMLDRPGGIPSLHCGRRRLVAREALDDFARGTPLRAPTGRTVRVE